MAGTVKAFGLPMDYALHELSYANMVLMGATLPAYGGGGRGASGGADGARVDGSDRRNQAAVAAAFREG